MVRRLCILLLLVGPAVAQDGEDSGISVDERSVAEPTPRPAREAGSNVETVTIKKNIYSIDLPADWVLVDESNHGELSWDVLLPGSTHRATLRLRRREGCDSRSRPYYDAKWARERSADAKVEVRMEPCPRSISWGSRDGTEWIDACFYRSILNNPYELSLSCAASDFAQAEADTLKAVASFTADVKLWPPIPEGYKTSQQGTWLVATAPNVTDSIAPVVKTLKDQEARFRRFHGSLPKSDAPLVALVVMSKADGALIEPDVAGSVFDCYGDYWKRRVFAVPFGKDDDERASHLAYVAQDVLLLAKYGDMRPGWIWAGECVVAQAEAETGKPLPNLEEGFANWRDGLKLRLPSELDFNNPKYVSLETWPRECLFYVGALRHGKYRNEYRAFLRECAETSDCAGAAARFLAGIDEEDLRASTNRFMDGIKVVKRKDAKRK